MVVVDRPGFAGSEPGHCVLDIRIQARALAPLLETPPGQGIILVGQSYGGAIASLMAQANPRRVAALVLLSSYLGEPGPTAQRLIQLGERLSGFIPRDLRNAVEEVRGQPAQLQYVRAALARLRMPVHVVHGEADDFAPIEAARTFTRKSGARSVRFCAVPGAGHFINDGPAETLLASIEACIPSASRRGAWRWPDWLRGGVRLLGSERFA